MTGSHAAMTELRFFSADSDFLFLKIPTTALQNPSPPPNGQEGDTKKAQGDT